MPELLRVSLPRDKWKEINELLDSEICRLEGQIADIKAIKGYITQAMGGTTMTTKELGE